MKTNHNGHALRSLTNRVIAVIDDGGTAQAAIDTLQRTGVAEREPATLSGTEGLRHVDAQGIYSGGLTQAWRAIQRLTVEGDHLRRYEAELAGGHHIVDVPVHGRRNRDAVVAILRRHGAHFINAYGQWTIENVAA